MRHIQQRMQQNNQHNFHIPVMGLGFTIDTPSKVARYGINSVISIMDDQLLEQMRACICAREHINYQEISNGETDYRAKRITAYLNLMKEMVDQQVNKIRNENFEDGHEINTYFQLLPDHAEAKKLYNELPFPDDSSYEEKSMQLKDFIVPGSIDVNIMTKIDNTNYDKEGNELPSEHSDALAALRGYVNSDLSSSVIFSAGLNPRLYAYCENFDDFFPDKNGNIRKKIVLKVSDYRSALIQGKYLAKKGLWTSEYRIESGINCGGHAFVSDGNLFGPILEEFKNKREELYHEIYNQCINGLETAGRIPFKSPPGLQITAQGGIGTSDENEFLLKNYNLNGTGWGSPFLLVPEATNVDRETLNHLSTAVKDDYYLSDSSPLGVLFNNFRPSSSELQRKNRIAKNRPGSPCYKKILSNNTEFTAKPICTASRQYQQLKIKQLRSEIQDEIILKSKIEKVLEKDCLCEGLGAAALLVNEAPLSHELTAVTICPGPNLAYFSGIFTLKEMAGHIYGRLNILNSMERPNCFINELQLYLTYFKKEVVNSMAELSNKKEKYLEKFRNNLLEGITYYENLFEKDHMTTPLFSKRNREHLAAMKEMISSIMKHQNIQLTAAL